MMWNIPTKERLDKIPRFCETEATPLQEKFIHLHFFIGGCDWYIAEYDGKDLFFGFAILNNDYEMAEWGYVSFRELKSIKVDGWLEVDCELEEIWTPKRAGGIEQIRIAQGWLPRNHRQRSCEDQAFRGEPPSKRFFRDRSLFDLEGGKHG